MKNKTVIMPKIPTIVIVFGATGDLMAKKITPALFRLFKNDSLPDKFRVVGFARRDLSEKDFKDRMLDVLRKKGDLKKEDKRVRDFLSLYAYEQGVFDKKSDYEKLSSRLKEIDGSWGMCSNKLFYLAVPPELYPEILGNLHKTGLSKPCGGPDEGWTRVIVEKPFGKDLKSARDLDKLLGGLFEENQIYRIDHYLAKEMLQNILTFRFSNNLFESSWGNDLIERINIRLLESIGVEDRGGFYDGVGALRDVGQNHLLQMLALATMDKPRTLSAADIRASRAKILDTLAVPSKEDVKNGTFRAQYDGYRTIKGVTLDSDTETYFRASASLDHPRWRGVKIMMESGKRLGRPLKEIEIIFKHPNPCFCPPGSAGHYRNSLVIHLEPVEGITIDFWSKKPGRKMELEKRSFTFEFRNDAHHSQYTEEYEKLLLDCIADDQTLFVSSDEIEKMWKFVDPIVKGWKEGLVPLKRYRPDSRDISKEAESAASKTGSGLKKEIGIVGLGKMGANIARSLNDKGWKVRAWNRTAEVTKNLGKEGIEGTYSMDELISGLPSPKIVWLMVPAGKPVDEMLFGKDGISKRLKKGDIVVDGGNSFFEDSIRRGAKLKKLGIEFMDAGVSGGPSGARNGASIMVGGDKRTFKYLEPLFSDLTIPGGYGYMGKSGAGHFVKMVHNGIEYGMMQALAEGFAVIKRSELVPDLKEVARVYGRGSVITSRLVDWLTSGFEEYGDDLKEVSGTVAHTGEGEWTVKTAKKLGVPVKVIEDSFKFRVQSEKTPSYIGQILSALRNQFGGHSIKSGKPGRGK